MSKRIRDTYPRLGELLVRKGVAKPDEIDAALAVQRAQLTERRRTPKLGQILVDQRVLDKAAIDEILEEQKLGRGEKRKLDVGLRESGGLAVVALEGRLDETLQDNLTRVLESLMDRGFARIAIDGSKLVYLNSHGVSAFIAYIDEARARGGDLKFFGLNIDTRFILDRLGLTRFVQLFNTEAEAVHAFELPIDEYMSRGALGEYVAPSKGRTFHLSYCASMQSVHEENKIYFESKHHARQSNRKPCNRCRP